MKCHAVPIIAAVLMLLPVLYAGSYFALVEQPIFSVPMYRVDSAAIVRFYWPLEQIDRTVRADRWEHIAN